ncbi:Aste57867_19946 [Aphanomyces stellatus]|uniref:Aste57867_19946 protein n=1 Tax=Aphanomyces stellatus TaxID=120398 RepID=A0A485LDY5_9STRA|nr:hypothetical protein As57867_019880 [Aphanomyces stellatus]VFT96643.1 Aste57867_19946 [Aphanomyces stellatus]
MHGPRVAPQLAWVREECTPQDNPRHMRRIAMGFLYVVATSIGTILYLVVLAPSISNDNLWPNMNTTGVQTFLGDLYNAKLTTGAAGPLDLFASTAVVRKDYSTPTTYIDMRPAAARAVLLSKLPLETTIQVFRSVPFSESMQTIPQACWADLQRSFEMARTARHQELCTQRRIPNAAYYLEALFRNLKSNDLASSTYLASIQKSIFAYIQTTPTGPTWIQAMMTPFWLDVSHEVGLWQSHGLVFFQNSFQNYYIEGTQESLTLVNALGMRQSITISAFTAFNRPKTQWSSAKSYTGLWNDIDASASMKGSLLRAAPNNFEIVFNASWESWDFNFWGTAGTPATAILRSSLGPFTLHDVFLIPPPPSLLELVSTFQDVLNTALLANSTAYFALSEPGIDPTPSDWVYPGAVYYGGNPVCPYGIAKPYVQTSFGYYDDCGDQIAHTIQLTRNSMLFALMATAIQPPALASVCRLASHTSFAPCMETLVAAIDVLNLVVNSTAIDFKLSLVTQDVIALNSTFVQWATINGTNVALHQPMVLNNSNWDPWSFVGWMTMYEWVNGLREVYTFESDWDIWTLMSSYQAYVPLAANPVELPRTACTYLWFVSIYISVVLVFVFSLVLVYGSFVARFDVEGRDLFFSNRLVGGSWIGRPFLFVRGLTAILVLGTSPVALQSYSGLVKLDFVPRPTWQILLLAGEATWITYVLNDMLLPVTKPHSTLYASINSLSTWLIAVAIESVNPYKATATIGRACTILSFSRGLQCTNGAIHIGNVDRVALLFGIVICTVPLAYSIVRLFGQRRAGPEMIRVEAIDSFHLTGSSEAFLVPTSNRLGVVACILSGLIPFGNYIFDVKNWIVFTALRIGQSTYLLPAPSVEVRRASDDVTTARRRMFEGTVASGNKIQNYYNVRGIGILGLGYMCGAAVTSFLYLFASQSYFTNDFLWLGFSDTNTQAFLVNWFNVQLQLANSSAPFQMNDAAYGDYATTNNVTQYNVFSSSLYAIMIQDEANSLTNVVQGLRAMDSCHVPWIATAYCFVDFDQSWQMAFSAERQQRCKQNEGDNGAVYLETMLRNANWQTLSECWGSALDTCVFASIQTTNTGVQWSTRMKTPNLLSVGDEIEAWRAHGITRFTTMWQNYKILGVTESFLVSNFAGNGYPLTLKKLNSSFHLSGATAFKMYSPLATSLMASISNTSFLSGKSLIRSSATFVFANATPQDAFLNSGVLLAPMNPAYVVFSATISPFGVVDIKRVPPPQNLCDLYRDMRHFLLSKLSQSDAIQAFFWAMYTQYLFYPQPAAWDPPAQMWGGDINCGLNFGGFFKFPLQYFSSTGLCGSGFRDYMKPYTQNVVMAVLAMGTSNPPNATLVSLRDPSHIKALVGAINGSLNLITQFLSPSEQSQFDSASADTKATMRDELHLQFIQYLSHDHGLTFELSRINFFSPTEPHFDFFAWLYLFEWAEGKREVISIQGALDTLTTMSSTKLLVQELTNVIEIPLNVGRFFYAIIFYITAVLFAVGCLVTVYIIDSRGYVDGINVIAFNYVAGHVWIGRPLMLLRSLTSVALLSTSRLTLVAPRSALTSYFQSPPREVLTTLVSSCEICWLVYIFIDTFSVATGEYTAYYSTPSVAVVSLSVAVLSFAAPTGHAIALSRQCIVVAVDFDVSCVSGRVDIGDYTRFGTLIGFACGGCLLTYIGVRVTRPRPPRFPPLSPLLYSAAKTEYEHTTHIHWVHEGIYYLDKASAAMTGILTLNWRGVLYVADIKTWRVYVMPVKQPQQKRSAKLPPQFRYALPLDSASIDSYQ